MLLNCPWIIQCQSLWSWFLSFSSFLSPILSSCRHCGSLYISPPPFFTPLFFIAQLLCVYSQQMLPMKDPLPSTRPHDWTPVPVVSPHSSLLVFVLTCHPLVAKQTISFTLLPSSVQKQTLNNTAKFEALQLRGLHIDCEVLHVKYCTWRVFHDHGDLDFYI